MESLLSSRSAVVRIYPSIMGFTSVALAAELLLGLHTKPILAAASISALIIMVVELDSIREKGYHDVDAKNMVTK